VAGAYRAAPGLSIGAGHRFAFRQSFGFDATGSVSPAVFRLYALTLDFDGMRLFLER
jgi:hypothetical protein